MKKKPGKTTDNPAAPARRRLLRALGGGGTTAPGALSSPQWTRPLVKAVVLPAHAQTSLVETTDPVGCAVALTVDFLPGPSQTGYSLSAVVDGTVPFPLAITGGDDGECSFVI